MTDLAFVCANPVDHSPRPLVPVRHHILPKSWGGGEQPANLVRICGTCHDNAHDLLNLYRRHGGRPPWEKLKHYSVAVRGWAAQAWRQRPSDTPPWTLSTGETDA